MSYHNDPRDRVDTLGPCPRCGTDVDVGDPHPFLDARCLECDERDAYWEAVMTTEHASDA